ncbi:MAG: hypothetical protein GXP61_05925 [Epsilonproteobacteria bacterium]|nr:hypothetical protein [Campylobacterota bacterium]
MAKIDEIKEFIGFLKVLFVTLVAVDTSLIAWIFKNHVIPDKISVYVVFGIVLVITVIVCLLFVYILKNIKKLKDL